MTTHRCPGIFKPPILTHLLFSRTRKVSLAPLQLSTSPSLATASWQEGSSDLVSVAQAPNHESPHQQRSEALLTACSPLTDYEVVSQNPGAIFKDYWKNKIASFFFMLARRVRLTSLEAKGPRSLIEVVQPQRPSQHHAASRHFPGPWLSDQGYQ